ncbi:MAG: cytochrome c biogenesis protein CcsA [Muribaculaceae bacterium]|nr:cytochrome c biogenesis protein CcsA [Muribaculaceae bacterium]
MNGLRKIYRWFGSNPGSLLLHFSLILITAGAIATWISRDEGKIRLHPGESTHHFLSQRNGAYRSFPDSLKLIDFSIDYYPGGKIPRDYLSQLSAGGKEISISMNNIYVWDGYRLMQSGYDSEGCSIIAVSRDPVGIPLVYSGFLLFAIGGGITMIWKDGRFRRLLRGGMFFLLLLSGFCQTVKGEKIPGISRESADSLMRCQVVYAGKYVTFNTVARDVMVKIYGKTSYRGLTAEQTVASFKLYPSEWKDMPLIRIKDKKVRSALGIKGEYASLSDLFDKEGNYRLTPLLADKSMKEIEEVDEKAGILLSLISGTLLQSDSSQCSPLPEWKVDLELLYNRLPLSSLLFIILFSGAFLILLSNISAILKPLQPLISKIILAAALTVSLAAFILQWILSGRFPISNTFETLEFSVIIILMLLMLTIGNIKDSSGKALISGCGMLLCGALALVAHIVEQNPVITPLMPVLHSPWLSIHVSVVMTSYSLLLLTAVNSVAALFHPASSLNLRRLSCLLLYPGVWLLGLGIITGAVWANISWGRYWSWDPKENWALITLLIYALPLHQRLFPKKDRDGNRRFHLYLLLAALAIAMTYFGVNLLNSQHAYR